MADTFRLPSDIDWSICLETVFTEEPVFERRIRDAAGAGFRTVEFWCWRAKDIARIADAAAASGIRIAGFVAEPMVPLTHPKHHDDFLEGLTRSLETAQTLGARILIVQAGDALPDIGLLAQRAAVVDCLRRAANVLDGTDVVLALEPLNTVLDHPGYFLDRTALGLEIVADVDHPNVRLLYDIYHAAMMGEAMTATLLDRIDLVAHVHLADIPGRHEPGSGKLDWQDRLSRLFDAGYRGAVGLEFRPERDSVSALATFRAALDHRG